MTPIKKWFGELFSKDRRKGSRREATQLVAFYWDGGAPVPHRIRDITPSGAYLLTEQRWYPGTIVMMTLQRTENSVTDSAGRSISIQARVVRAGSDGVGLQFLVADAGTAVAMQSLGGNIADRRMISRFVQAVQSESGEVTGEIALWLAPPAHAFQVARKIRTCFGDRNAVSFRSGSPTADVSEKSNREQNIATSFSRGRK